MFSASSNESDHSGSEESSQEFSTVDQSRYNYRSRGNDVPMNRGRFANYQCPPLTIRPIDSYNRTNNHYPHCNYEPGAAPSPASQFNPGVSGQQNPFQLSPSEHNPTNQRINSAIPRDVMTISSPAATVTS